MAETPADKPKRRRTTKTQAGEASAAKPARTTRAKAPAKKAEAPKEEQPKAAAAPAKKPAASRAKAPARQGPAKQAAAPAAAAKPAPRRRAAPRKSPPTPAATPAPTPAPAPQTKATAPAAARPAAPPPVERESFPEPPKVGWLAALGAAAAVGGAWFVWRASRAEEPDYQTIESDGAVEIRKYPSLVTAGTHARGERQQALNEGFRTLADYIFAKSRPGAKLPMTAPVLADASGNGGWRTRFIMPRGKARAELPAAPDGVELTAEPAARIAAIRFPGRADDATLETKEAELRSWLQTKGLPHEGKAVHAFYNAPFLPGPFRRNEVLIRLSDEGGMTA
ncbi:heme-binding protein [Sphingomonas sp.]|uniref:SOUL family heme-binding protein n=1 Tax=Sphingomonas sp. TaxID=28214 RepID=UPI002E0EA99C